MKMVDPNEKVNEIVDPNFWLIEDLPSKYMLYPKDTKISGKRLSVPEVKKLAQMNEDNYASVIRFVLSNAIKGIDVDDILIADKLYLIFWLRANTYREPGYDVEFKCNLCKNRSFYEFELDLLKVNYIVSNFNDIKIIPIQSAETIEISYCNIKTFEAMKEIQKNNEKIDIESLDLAANIKIGDLSLADRYKYLDTELSAEQYSKLNSYLKKYWIGIDDSVTIPCRLCGGQAQVGVTFRRDFFIPEYKFE